jgi:hypothetical protein
MKKFSLAMQDVAEIRASVEAQYPDDADLLEGMMEGETDLYKWMQWIETKRLEDDERLAGIASVEADLKERKARLKKRIEARKNMAIDLLHLSGIGKVELATATWTPTNIKPKRVVTDPDLLPDDCVKIERKPVMANINALPECPPGVTVDNGRASVRITTK